MTWGLATLAIAAAITGDWEGDMGARLLVSGGQAPLDANTEQVLQGSIELSPAARLRYIEGNKGLELSYSPRLTLRHVFETDPNARVPPDPTAFISFHTGDLSLRWRATRRTSIELGGTAGFGLLSFNDALQSATSAGGSGSEPNTLDAQDVLTLGGHMSVSTVVVPRGDVFRISGEFASFNTITGASTDGAAAPTALDRMRVAGSVGYLFSPTSVDGFELAANGEASFYPNADDVTGQQQNRQGAAFGGATLGWVRELSRRSRGSLRAGVLLLFNDTVQVVPSALIDCSIDTYQGPGLRIVTTFSAGFVGGTSSVDVAAEPRVVAGYDMRFTIVPDQSFGINIGFNAPLSLGGDEPSSGDRQRAASLSSLIIGLPYALQLTPGFDLELGARFGLRGVIRTTDEIPVDNTGNQVADFGDTYDAQVYLGLSWAIASTGESRFQR